MSKAHDAMGTAIAARRDISEGLEKLDKSLKEMIVLFRDTEEYIVMLQAERDSLEAQLQLATKQLTQKAANS